MKQPKVIDFVLREENGEYQGTVTVETSQRGFSFAPLCAAEEATRQQLRRSLNDQTEVKPSQEALVALGRALYARLFGSRTVQELLPGGPDGQIRLRIDAPTLQIWPWEMLHDGDDWLFRKSSQPLIRLLPADDAPPVRPAADPLTILIHGAMVDERLKLLKLKAVVESIQARHAFKAAVDKGQIRLNQQVGDTPAESPDLDELKTGLDSDPAILCLLCHGKANALVLKKIERIHGAEVTTTTEIDAETLKEILAATTPPLVIVAACESSAQEADTDGDGQIEMVEGFVQQLATLDRIGAVVGMQFLIGESQLADFLASFFAAIASYVPIDRAFATARRNLADDSSFPITIFSPVLYSRLDNGVMLLPQRGLWEGPWRSDEGRIEIPSDRRVNRELFAGADLLVQDRVKLEAGVYGRASVQMGSGVQIEAGVVSAGPITIGPYAMVHGTLLSLTGVCELGQGRRVQGGIVTTGDVHVGDGCEIDSIYAEGDVYLGRHCQVGWIWARRVKMEAHCRVRVVDAVDLEVPPPHHQDGWFAIPSDVAPDGSSRRRYVRAEFYESGQPVRLLEPAALAALQRIDTLAQRLGVEG